MPRVLPSLALLTLFTLSVIPPAFGAQVPAELKPLVMGARHRPAFDAVLDGAPFRFIDRGRNQPFLLWPAGDREGLPLRSIGAVESWLRASGKVLGHRELRPTFAERFDFRGLEVWAYQLSHRGVPVRDARVLVLFDSRGLVGILNQLPGVIRAIEAADTPYDVLYPSCRSGLCDLLPAHRRDTLGGDRIVTTFECEGRILGRLVTQTVTPDLAATFSEYTVPGTFPDQIDLDSSGVVWFSQPLNNQITSFDPVGLGFNTYPGIPAPDGFAVESADVSWTGLYDGTSGLGRFDTVSKSYTAFAAPYSGPNMAIPLEATDGTIWVTDHQANRISQFDPVANSWVQSLTMPTPNCWVVGGTEDPSTQSIYFTENNVNQLGMKPPSGGVVDIPVPGAGPAFAVYSNGVVYYSEWTASKLGAYDIASGIATEYAHPVPNEWGGPLALAPNGDVVVGTRNVGYVLVFTPSSGSFTSHQIPTAGSGLKDGIIVAPSGTIWFTESGAGKLGRLDLDLPPTADFVGSPTTGPAPLDVVFTDLSTNAPTSWLWDFGDGATATSQNPLHTYTAPGSYDVSLTATNAFGSDTETKVGYVDVTSGCNAPGADFQGTPTAGPAPLSVAFGDLSTNGPTSWLWDFGDGSTSTTQAPTHIYATPGLYTVSLTVSNACGSDALTRPDYVVVRATEEIVTGPGPSNTAGPTVKTWDRSLPPSPLNSWNAYGGSGYGVNVAGADIQSGGSGEVLSGPGPGAVYGPQVRGWRAGGTSIGGVNFYAYGTLRYGVHVAGGDLDADPHAEILSGAGPGAVFGPHVRGWNHDGASISPVGGISFYAYQTLKYGVRVGAGDGDGDAFAEILTGAGAGFVFGPHVRSFDFDGGPLSAGYSFFAFASGRYGAAVGSGDTDGDGRAELVVAHGPDPAMAGEVKGFVFDASVSNVWQVSAFSTPGGAEVAVGDLAGDGTDDVLAAPGWGSPNPARIRGWEIVAGTGSPIPGLDFLAYPATPYGAKVSTTDVGI